MDDHQPVVLPSPRGEFADDRPEIGGVVGDERPLLFLGDLEEVGVAQPTDNSRDTSLVREILATALGWVDWNELAEDYIEERES